MCAVHADLSVTLGRCSHVLGKSALLESIQSMNRIACMQVEALAKLLA